MKRLLLLSVTLLVVLSNKASVYYVDVTNGLDSNTGSINSKWKTIQHAADNAGAGDTVNVYPGNYYEEITLKSSGTLANPIIFQAATNWLAIVDNSKAMTNNWVPAPEVGAGVWKNTTDGTFETHEMTIDGKRLMFFWTNGDMTTSWNIYTSPPTTTGFGGMALPANQMVTLASGAISYPFWQGVKAMYLAWYRTNYIRFADGHNPNGENIRVAPNLAGSETSDVYHPILNWNGKSNIVWRGFSMRGGFACIDIEGSGANNNIVESNRLAGGMARIVLTLGSSNIFRFNDMTDDFYGTNTMGAWSGGSDTTSACNQNLWNVSKFLSGGASVNSHGVRAISAGSGTQIYSNNIYNELGEGVLIGNTTTPYTSNSIIAYNNISNVISHCLMLWPFEFDTLVFSNFLANGNVNQRWHIVDQTGDSNSRLYIFRNKSWEPAGVGEHIFTYRDDSAAPTTFRTNFCYQNSFSGGQDFLQVSSYLANGGLPYCYFFNNLISSNHYIMNNAPGQFLTNSGNMGEFDYNVVTPPYASFPIVTDPVWFSAHNIKTNVAVWAPNDQSFTIATGNIAIGNGTNATAFLSGSVKDIGFYDFNSTPPLWNVGTLIIH